jgi:predicted DNA-binding protein
MAGRPKKEKTAILYARVPERLGKRLRADAKKEGREVSGTVRIIIEKHYAEMDSVSAR